MPVNELSQTKSSKSKRPKTKPSKSKQNDLRLEEVSLLAMSDQLLNEVVNIETQAQPVPWSRLQFEQSMSAGHRCQCVLVEDRVLAFSVVDTVLDEVHILNLAAHPDYHGQGLGHVLMDDVTKFAQASSVKRLFLEVRESNNAAISMYQKWGFTQIAIRKHYYRTPNSGRREHALVMVLVME